MKKLTIAAAARRAGVARSTIYAAMDDGRLPFVRLTNGRRGVDPPVLDRVFSLSEEQNPFSVEPPLTCDEPSLIRREVVFSTSAQPTEHLEQRPIPDFSSPFLLSLPLSWNPDAVVALIEAALVEAFGPMCVQGGGEWLQVHEHSPDRVQYAVARPDGGGVYQGIGLDVRLARHLHLAGLPSLPLHPHAAVKEGENAVLPKRTVARLLRLPLTVGIDIKEVARLASVLLERRLWRGDRLQLRTLHDRRPPADALVIAGIVVVLEGVVQRFVTTKGEERPLDRVGPGGVLGAASTLFGIDSPWKARALVPVRLAVLPAGYAFGLTVSAPSFASLLISWALEEQRSWTRQKQGRRSVPFSEMAERVAVTVSELSSRVAAQRRGGKGDRRNRKDRRLRDDPTAIPVQGDRRSGEDRRQLEDRRRIAVQQDDKLWLDPHFVTRKAYEAFMNQNKE
ncbi:MAG: Crp/Fnr family transcriptional regulator [Magnetococcales bacterium]|nr:Crp/Fnr family transcriptional regulator [Magnetococcales bacterium]